MKLVILMIGNARKWVIAILILLAVMLVLNVLSSGRLFGNYAGLIRDDLRFAPPGDTQDRLLDEVVCECASIDQDGNDLGSPSHRTIIEEVHTNNCWRQSEDSCLNHGSCDVRYTYADDGNIFTSDRETVSVPCAPVVDPGTHYFSWWTPWELFYPDP
jgi:hypothetical protein